MNFKILLMSCLLGCGWLSTGITSTGFPTLVPLRTGQDYALFFAVDTYEHMDDLQNPIRNANQIAVELHDNFGFQTEVITNPTLDDIDNKLAEYKRKFNNGSFDQNGQLFIYFSGHGIAINNNGYFMTSLADSQRPHRTAMDYDFYRDQIDQIACQHIMVAIDACHSATFDPKFSTRSNRSYGRPGEREFDRVLAHHESYRTRVFWTSDGAGNETPDRSSFAYQLLEGLRSHQSPTPYLRSKELYTLYLEKATPRPGGGSFGRDEPNSCFLFFRNIRINIGDARADRVAYQAALSTNTLEGYRQYLRDFPNGDFRSLVQAKVNALEAEKRELLAWSRAKQQNTHAAYETFLRDYPNSIYVPVAENNLNALAPSPLREASPDQHASGGWGGSENFIRIEGGTFTMGCQDGRDTDCYDSEKPAHQVTLSTFYMTKYEMTQAQWRQVMGSDPPELHNKGCDQCPVNHVSWEDIQEFIEKLNALTNKNHRLPTEAEWEYASRGGNQSKGYLYSGSNELDEVAWWDNNAKALNTIGTQKTTHPVGTKKPNELGLYDMAGNVWEWCSDWYESEYYKNSPRNNPQGPTAGSRRLLRGGSWNYDSRYCRSASRLYTSPGFRGSDGGFRLALSF